MKRLGVLTVVVLLMASCMAQSTQETDSDTPASLLITWSDGSPLGELAGANPNADLLLSVVTSELAQRFAGEALGDQIARVVLTLDRERMVEARRVLSRVDGLDRVGAALVSTDPASGAVLAYAIRGSEAALFDVTAGSGRQSGSTFKVVGLVAALQSGVPMDREYEATDCLLSEDVPDVGPICSSGSNQPESLLEGLVHSYNSVYFHLARDIGPDAVVDQATAMGVTSQLEATDLTVLGYSPVRIGGLASVFSTLAAGGRRQPFHLIDSIYDASGAKIDLPLPGAEQVIDPEIAAQVVEAMEQVVERGTGVAADIKGTAVAGKTGTSLGVTDAWFAGIGDGVATVVWVGVNDPNSDRLVPPTTPQQITGGGWPAEMWREYTLANR